MERWKLFMIILIVVFGACDSDPESQVAPSNQDQLEIPVVKNSTLEYEGNTYATVEINGMIWLAENLKISTADSWCYQNLTEDCKELGRLYRWESANRACEKLGPEWRLPSDQDWKKLTTKFGGYREWLEEKDYGDPKKANAAMLDKQGFHAVLNGWRGSTGGFDSKGKAGFYWSSSEADEDRSIFYIFYPENGKVTRRATKKTMGMSCRCVKKVEG